MEDEWRPPCCIKSPNTIPFLPCPFHFRSVLESQNTNLLLRNSDNQYSSSTNRKAVLEYNSPTKSRNDFRLSDGYVSLFLSKPLLFPYLWSWYFSINKKIRDLKWSLLVHSCIKMFLIAWINCFPEYCNHQECNSNKSLVDTSYSEKRQYWGKWGNPSTSGT